jgi:hemoglobin-like flavoprotein
LPTNEGDESVVSPTQIQLVQTTWEKLLPIQNEAARLFYDRLFALDPSANALFRSGDMREQGRKLTAMITIAVNGLKHLDTIVPAIRELGRRHAGYRVTDAHYDTVGAALIWTLELGLGDDFTPEVQAAWVDVYTLLADTMKQAAAMEIA